MYGNTCTKKGGEGKKQREKGENPAMIFNIVEKQRTKHLSHLNTFTEELSILILQHCKHH